MVSWGSTWRFLDDGSNQGNSWNLPAFDDSGWSSGPAQLGYGDGDEATVVSFGTDANNKHITTYFRTHFPVADPATIAGLKLEIIRDDGVIAYLNGTEVFRDNLPAGPLTTNTLAVVAIGGTDESTPLTAFLDPALLVSGTNVLAIEIHQANATSSDISFDLQLTDEAPPPPALVRGPYLQRANSNQVTIKWRTDQPTSSLVRFGTDSANLDQAASTSTLVTDHEVILSGLTPDTRYFYSVGDDTRTFATGPDHFADTHPLSGTAEPVRIWVLGDSGTADANAAAVRDAYLAYNGSAHADVWLMLGDNAYDNGTDAEFQAAVFDFYPQSLRNSVLWSTLGNHDGYSADSATQSGPYFDIFTLPTGSEGGGVASGTEAYYSFDYAHVHFICLDSYDTDRSATGAMASWLAQDLAATTQEWIVAFWHHPPYSKGSHDSDLELNLVEMRENFLPILESYGVDLVLGGHSHSYERSMLIDGHYGASSTFGPQHTLDSGTGDPAGDGSYTKAPAANQGAVYAVPGSSGKLSAAPLDHPVMIVNLLELGSMVIDVNGNELEAVFLDATGGVQDRFRIVHELPPTEPPAPPSDLTAGAVSSSEIQLDWVDNSDDENAFLIERSLDGTSWTSLTPLPAGSTSFLDSGLTDDTLHYYRVVARNDVGDSAPSNVASATTPALPASLDYHPTAETTTRGTVSGTYLDTWQDDDNPEILTEDLVGGNPRKSRSILEHTWTIDYNAGTTNTLIANAHAAASPDGDAFLFSYSFDGGASWTEAFTVSSTDPANVQSAILPAGPGGSALIRVTDTDQTNGNSALDSISVDQLFLRVSATPGDPPTAPSGLAATAVSPQQIDLSWLDQSDNELGFELERLTTGAPTWELVASLPADTNSFSDSSVAGSTTYDYRVRTFNPSGSSEWSNVASATTPIPPTPVLVLAVTGEKTKGKIDNTLTWTGASGPDLEVFRNGELIATVSSSPATFVDAGVRGGGTFTYQLRELGDPPVLSNEASITF